MNLEDEFYANCQLQLQKRAGQRRNARVLLQRSASFPRRCERRPSPRNLGHELLNLGCCALTGLVWHVCIVPMLH